MDYKNYFNSTTGKGFLSTANSNGEVNTAFYSRPYVLDDGTLVFGMTDRLTHANLQENPHAIYAFNESGYSGRRFYLKKIKEETEGSILKQVKESANKCVFPGAGSFVKFVVHFKVTKDLPLVVDICSGDHSKHLCELAGNEKFDLIKELAKEPDFMCVNCGRMAAKKESLCNPMPLEDIPFGTVS
jgi:hypothetical protein